MADETRTVGVELELTKTGETGAIKETTADLEQLDASAVETTAALQGQAAAAAEAKAATEGVGGAASEAAPAIGGLAKEAEAARTATAGAGEGIVALGASIGPVLLLVAGLTKALEAAQDKLNEIGHSLGARGDEFKLFSNPITAAVDGVRSMISTLSNLGDGLVAFELKQGSATEKMEAAKQALLGLAPAARQYKEAIDQAIEAANKQAETLAEVAHELEQSGDSHGAVAKRIGEDVDKLLAKYKELGIDPPKVLTDLVARYREVGEAARESGAAVSDSAQRAAAATKAQAEETRALEKEQADEKKQAEELAAATARLIEQQTHLETATVQVGDQTIKVSDIFKNHAANVKAAGDADAAAAEGLGDVVDQGARADKVFSGASDAVDDFADRLARVPEEAAQAESAFDRIVKGAQAANDALLHKGPRGADPEPRPDDFAPVVEGENTQLDAQATRFAALREKVDALNQSELTLQATTDGLIGKFDGMDAAAAKVDAVSAAIDKVLEKASAIAELTGIETSIVASMQAIVAEAANAVAAIQQVHDAAKGGGGEGGQAPAPAPDGGDSGGGGAGGF